MWRRNRRTLFQRYKERWQFYGLQTLFLHGFFAGLLIIVTTWHMHGDGQWVLPAVGIALAFLCGLGLLIPEDYP